MDYPPDSTALMKKILTIFAFFIVLLVLSVEPFWHIGGHYYRGLLLIWDIRTSSGTTIPIPPLNLDISLVRWADPTSFHFVHGGEFYSYAKDRFGVYRDRFRLNEFDPKSFRPVQAPHTGEWFYIDDRRVRVVTSRVLNAVSGDSNGYDQLINSSEFDMPTFELLGGGIFKDKNGVYKYFRDSSTLEKTTPEHDRGIILFRAETLLEPQTFRVDSCDANECRASDAHGVYSFSLSPVGERFDIRRLEP